MSRAQIIIAEDHQVVRDGLRDIIQRTPDLQVLAEAGNGAMADHLARTLPADLLLMDIAMPVRRGMEVLETLRKDGYTLPVVFFTMYSEAQFGDYARLAGAQGFVGKDADTPYLLKVIRSVLAGGSGFAARPHRSRPTGDPFAQLSQREMQVVQGLLQGHSLMAIAERMQVGNKTVSTYRSRLLTKLDLHSNAQLVALAIAHGYH